MLVLWPSGVRVSDYEPAKQLMVFLLGPATVSLAVPLYKNRHALLRNAVPALTGLAVGSLATLLSALLVAKLLGLPEIIRVSLSIKSVTAPIAIELAPIVHADPTLTAAFVVVTGMIGAMLGPRLMSAAGVHDPLARGLALGTLDAGAALVHVGYLGLWFAAGVLWAARSFRRRLVT